MIVSHSGSAFHPFHSVTSGCRSPRRTRFRVAALSLLTGVLLATALPEPALAAENDAVRVWNEQATLTLVNGPGAPIPGLQFPPPVAFIHLAIVQGAVYDAVNAIKGGHAPYLPGIKAATSASKGAAAATAAHHVLVALVNQAPLTVMLTAEAKATIKARLDAEYAKSLAEIAAGEAKKKGVEVGAAAAAAMLVNRTNDGRFGAGGFVVGSAPGQWRPVPPALANDPNAWIRSVRPFALPSPEYFHVPAPLALNSPQYAAEFNEVKSLGAVNSATRTEAQTRLAQFTGLHPVLLLYPALRQLASARKLTISQQARFHAMTSMSGADSLINCWAEKAHWNFWRPTTAIHLAADDGNDATAPDAGWASLMAVPPYPDDPSGASCVFSGVMHGAKAYFGSDQASFELVSTGVGPGTGSTRQYTRFSDVTLDVIESRLLGGLHFRRANVNGVALGKKVAEYIDANYFNCKAPGQCKQEERE